MKLPALAIVMAFALGIACGLNPEIAHRSNSHKFVALVLCSASTSLLIGMFFVWRSRVVIAGLASLLCWVMLGVAAVCIEEQPRRADHILSLLDAGTINIKSPLRYYGRLADAPEKLPWGASYDVVVSPAGKTLLIDGGGAFGGFPGQEQVRGIDPGEEAVSPYLWSRGFKRIDVMALTHAHQDHVGGLSAILENFGIGRLWIGREVNNPTLAKLEALARERNIPIEYETRGKHFSLDDVQGEFLWPEISSADPAAAAKNNDSLVLKLKYRNRTLLLPGDAEKQAEHTMLKENSAVLPADVLKGGHHGSKNSTTQEFLDTVAPTIAIISSGEDNPYGHPSPELLERLEASGARVLRTDRDGAVHILPDGNRLEISCFVACAKLASVTISRRAETPNQNQNNQQ
jgi:beta-lactamase superfamily II metal-dependent hydrolase